MYTKEGLNSLGIHEVREIASNIGVHKAKERRKADAIDLILQVQAGLLAPHIKTGVGRPPIAKNKFLGIKIPDESFDFNKAAIKFATCSEFEKFEFKALPDAPKIKVSGAVEITVMDFGFIRKNLMSDADMDVIISNEVIGFKNLKSGDYIEAEAVPAVDGSVYIATKILEVNFGKTEQIKNFDTEPAKFSGQKIEFKTELNIFNNFIPIELGSRAFLVADNFNLLNKAAFNMFQKSCHCQVLYLKLDCLAEELSNSSNNVVLVPATAPKETKQQKVLQIFLRAKRCAELAENVILYVNDLCRLANIFSDSMNDGVIRIKQLLSIIKYSGKASISLIAGVSNYEWANAKGIMDLSSNHIYLNERLLLYTDIVVSLQKISLCRPNLETLMSEKNFNYLKTMLRGIDKNDLEAEAKLIDELNK